MELSIFVDESGDFEGNVSKYYLITFVTHNQSENITPLVNKYRQCLKDSGLADIPFHMSPLINGHDDYKALDFSTRQQLMSKFFILMQHLPFHYQTLAYKKAEFKSRDQMLTRMKRDFTTMLFDKLEYFQSAEQVKVYYDNGQQAVTDVIRDGIKYVLSKNAYIFIDANPREYILAQVADFICSLELTSLKYCAHEETATDKGFFGGSQSFKKNYLKKIRKKTLDNAL